jgi:hypothetical protein
MIKFFRKIRQNLLSEGKTGKYLKYALGEILLVVIGIVIALQIGDWNENRKRKDWGIAQEDALKTELINDLEALKSDIKYLERELKINRSHSKRLSAEDATVDTLVKIMRYEFSPVLNGQIEIDQTTFNSLKSSAKIDLLGNELSEKLQKYYSKRDRDFLVTYNNGTSYINLIESLIINYPFSKGAIAGPLQDLYWQNADLHKLQATFNGVLTFKIYVLIDRKSKMENVFDQTQELINYLDSNSNL